MNPFEPIYLANSILYGKFQYAGIKLIPKLKGRDAFNKWIVNYAKLPAKGPSVPVIKIHSHVFVPNVG